MFARRKHPVAPTRDSLEKGRAKFIKISMMNFLFSGLSNVARRPIEMTAHNGSFWLTFKRSCRLPTFTQP